MASSAVRTRGQLRLVQPEPEETPHYSSDPDTSLPEVTDIPDNSSSSGMSSASGLSPADTQLLHVAGITPDMFPELLDDDMRQLGLSLPGIIIIRRTRIGSPSSSMHTPAVTASSTTSTSAVTHTTPTVRPPIPTFRGAGSASYSDADEFLNRFEIAMNLSGEPQHRWNLILLNQFSNFTDLQFWQANAMSLSWSEAKTLFIQHFRHPNATLMRIDELTRVRQKPHESVREYLDRFSSLVRLSGQPHDSPLLVSYFRRGLQSSEIRRLIDLREDIQHPYSTYHDLSETALFCEAQLQRQRLDSDAVHHQPIKQRVHTFICSHHGPNPTHSTKDCRVLQSTPKPTYTPSSTTPTDIIHKSTKDTPATKPCWKCKGEGHWPNKCPNTPAPKPASSPSPASSSAASSSTSHAKPMFNMMESDSQLEPPPQLDLEESQEFTPDLLIPVVIQNSEFMGLIDTGANRSYMKQCHVETLNLSTVPTTSTIKLGDGSTVRQSIQTEPLDLVSNGRTLRCSLGILPNINYDLILGRDLLFRLGIGIHGVTHPASQTIDNSDADDNMLTDSKIDQTIDTVSSNDLAEIHSGISHVIEQNLDIPSEAFCTFPDSQVHILTGDQKPVFRRQYPIAQAFHQAVTEQIDKWLRTNRIRKAHSSTQWNLPLTVAPKKDLLGQKTAVRVCLDPRAINSILPDDNYPIPRISDLFDKLRGFILASSLDLRESYTQLFVNEEDQEKLSFTWNSVRYTWQGAPYGLKFLTSHFQRVMTSVLSDCLPFCIIFVDDVVVFSSSIQQHIEHLNRVIQALNNANLRLNIDKCRFGCTQLPILGHIVSGTQIQPDPEKISSFHNLPIPETGKQIESFLGLANYLRDYIPLYSKIASPLEKLRKQKLIGPHWTPDCQRAFDSLKAILSHAPVLNAAEPDYPLLVATDASQYGVGAVLYQLVNNRPRYIAFASKSLNPAQVNYPATRRELLAIVFAVSKFRNWLYAQRFTLFCDHSALSYLFTGKHESRMLNYWAYILCEYNFTIVHRPGILNVLPDALSRLYDQPSIVSTPSKLNLIDVDTPSQQTASQLKTFIDERFDKVCPPADQQSPILEQAHTLNHLGADALFKHIWTQGYFWSSLMKDCKKTVSQCRICQQFNSVRHGFHPLIPIHAELPFDHVAIDLAGPFPTSVRGHNFLLVITDIATRFTFLRAIPDKTANTVASQLYQVFCDCGFPKILQSDNGTEFVNSTMTEMKSQFGFDHRTISPYHPQANGAAESHVKIAKQLLVKLCRGDWNDWDIFVAAAQYGMNIRIAKRHGSAPFALMFARSPNTFRSYRDVQSKVLTESELIKRVDHMTTTVFPSIHEKTKSNSNKMADMFNKEHKIVADGFPEGSSVMMTVTTRKSKLHPKYEGPFKILRRTKGGSYSLLDSTGALYPKNVSPDKLKIISLPDAAPSYEVQEILDHRGPASDREYLVRWKGYSHNDDSWEPAANFDSPLLIQQYFQRLQAGRE